MTSPENKSTSHPSTPPPPPATTSSKREQPYLEEWIPVDVVQDVVQSVRPRHHRDALLQRCRCGRAFGEVDALALGAGLLEGEVMPLFLTGVVLLSQLLVLFHQFL